MCAQPQLGAALSAEEQEALDARLWAAAEGGDAAAVARLAGEGASADAKGKTLGRDRCPAVAMAAAEYGIPAVVAAAVEGHTEVVEALLRLGCDPNAPLSNGTTALMAAAGLGHGGVVGALLEHGGADLDAVDKHHGQTALMLAAAKGHAHTVAARRAVRRGRVRGVAETIRRRADRLVSDPHA